MDIETQRRLVRTWIEAGAELERVRWRELEAMTDDEAREAVLDLLTMPLPPDLPPRFESGLVEQQRWFARLRRAK